MSMLRKGQSLPDGTYIYTCGCGFKNSNCAYCCGNDLKRCQAAIKTSRGEIYYGLLKTIIAHVGKAMVADVHAIRAKQGKLVVVDIGWLSIKYDLNFKATAEWLEEVGACKSGSYERIKESRLKVRDILEAARKKWQPSQEAEGG